MVTTLYLVRHGETEGSETRRYKGSIDVALSSKGAGQIRAAAIFIQQCLRKASSSNPVSYLKDIHTTSAKGSTPPHAAPQLSAVYCSDLRRTVKSAEIIAGDLALRPVESPGLRERNFGIWEGMTFTEIREQYPAEFENWANNPLRYSPLEGESTLEVKERVIPLLMKILAAHEGSNIAVVAHGGVNRIILCHFLGVPLENIFRIEQDYAAVNIIELWDKYPVVKLINGGTLCG